MARLLYLQASPRIERSHSIAVANAFVEEYQKAHPEDEVVTFDVFAMNLPEFDGLAVQAKYTILHGQEYTPEQKSVWKMVECVIEEFKLYDKYVLAVPMWNFGIPYKLKQYIDILIQPGYTFKVDEEGNYQGLITGRPMFIAYARGGDYSDPQGQAIDFQTRYLETAMGFIGFENIKSVIVQPTLAGGPETAKDKRARAVEEARKMASSF